MYMDKQKFKDFKTKLLSISTEILSWLEKFAESIINSSYNFSNNNKSAVYTKASKL